MQATNRTVYKNAPGEHSSVRIEIAGIGTRRIRIAKLPPEITGRNIRTPLPPV